MEESTEGKSDSFGQTQPSIELSERKRRNIGKMLANLEIPNRGEVIAMFEREQEDKGSAEVKVVPEESVLGRLNSHKDANSYQLGKQLSCRWTTGAGPRIGCVRDYPSQLQLQALEQVRLSPRCDTYCRHHCNPYVAIEMSPRTTIPPTFQAI